MGILPDVIPLPRGFAAGLTIEGSYISARDLSYALAVAYLASQVKPEPGTRDHYRIPDNRLRGTLGLSRRDTVEVEEGRFRRLRDARFVLDVPIPMPTTMFRGDAPVRANLDDELTWIVDPRLIDLVTVTKGTPTVGLPLRLLVGARVRWSIELYLKLVAQHALGNDGPGIVAWGDDRIALRLSVDEICARFHLPVTQGSQLIQRYLEPAVDDLFDAAGVSLEVETRRSVTRRNPKGRIRDITVFMRFPAESPLEKQLRLELEDQSRTAWMAKPRVIEPKPAPPAPPSTINVTVLRPRGSTDTPRIRKIASSGSVETQSERDSTGKIEF